MSDQDISTNRTLKELKDYILWRYAKDAERTNRTLKELKFRKVRLIAHYGHRTNRTLTAVPAASVFDIRFCNGTILIVP